MTNDVRVAPSNLFEGDTGGAGSPTLYLRHVETHRMRLSISPSEVQSGVST